MRAPRLDRRFTWVFGLLLAATVAMVWSFRTIPRSNTAQQSFDAILVLGAPTTMQGSLSEEERWRVEEGVREFRAEVAPRLIFSGAAVAYRYVEADTMAKYAASLGVPPAAILTETSARNTIENIRNSAALMAAHGWTSVEVVSSADHVPRAALVLAGTGLQWRVHASPNPGRSLFTRVLYDVEEVVTTALLRWFGLRLAPVLHAIAVVQRWIGFAFRWVWYRAHGG